MTLRRLPLPFVVVLLLGACGDDNGQGQAAATGTTAVPSTGAPTTTLRGGTDYTFRDMTITFRPGWKVVAGYRRGQEVEVADGRSCIPSQPLPRPVCPGFELFGPELIANADEGQRPYHLDSPVTFGGDPDTCPTDPDNRLALSPRALPAPRFAKVGDHTAHYREWRWTCGPMSGGNATGPSYTERVWYLPRSRILIVDRWSTPGLQEALAGARWG